jgi:hypothetical protein
MKMENQDVYKMVEILIRNLKACGKYKIASILEHRMYKASWTSSSELFEELANVIRNALQEERNGLDEATIKMAEKIVLALDKSFNE